MATFKSNNLSSKLDTLSALLSTVNSYDLFEEYVQIRSTYSSMLHYMIKGVDDPNSLEIYSNLHRRCHELLHRINRIQRLSSNRTDKYTTSFKSSTSYNLNNLIISLETYCLKIKQLKI